jgi:hypothetical protein
MAEPTLNTAIDTALIAYGLMAVIAMLCAVMIRVIVVVLASAQDKAKAKAAAAAGAPTPVLVSVTPQRDQNAEIAAAIGAAVFAVLGAHRLVYIGDARQTASWTGELRSRLHTSHTPRQGGR